MWAALLANAMCWYLPEAQFFTGQASFISVMYFIYTSYMTWIILTRKQSQLLSGEIASFLFARGGSNLHLHVAVGGSTPNLPSSSSCKWSTREMCQLPAMYSRPTQVHAIGLWLARYCVTCMLDGSCVRFSHSAILMTNLSVHRTDRSTELEQTVTLATPEKIIQDCHRAEHYGAAISVLTVMVPGLFGARTIRHQMFRRPHWTMGASSLLIKASQQRCDCFKVKSHSISSQYKIHLNVLMARLFQVHAAANDMVSDRRERVSGTASAEVSDEWTGCRPVVWVRHMSDRVAALCSDSICVVARRAASSAWRRRRFQYV